MGLFKKPVFLKKSRKAGKVVDLTHVAEETVSYENIEKQLEGIAVVTALVLGFAVSQLFCADKAEVIEADLYLGTTWTSWDTLPSELMVNVGTSCALLEMFALVLDLILYQFLLNYCRDRDDPDQIRVWDQKFGWMLYLLYLLAFIGLTLYFWLLCICFTLRYPNPTDPAPYPDGNGTSCTSDTCHWYYNKSLRIYLWGIGLATAILATYLGISALYVTRELKRLRELHLEVPESLADLVDTVLCGVEGAPLDLLHRKTSKFVQLAEKAEALKETIKDEAAHVVLETRAQATKLKKKGKKFANKIGLRKGTIEPEEFGRENSILKVEAHCLENDEEEELVSLQRNKGDDDEWVTELHEGWATRHTKMIKALREFSYFKEAELVKDRSDAYLLQELVECGVSSVRDRACLVDILKDNGKKTRKYNKLIQKLVNDVKKNFKARRSGSIDAGKIKLDKSEQAQYQAMAFDVGDSTRHGSERRLQGVVPPSLRKYTVLNIVRATDSDDEDETET